MRPNVFEYLDYRAFLADSFAAMRERNPRISHRAFAKMAGLQPPNLLQMVVSGQRGLPEASTFSVAKALGLGRVETEFLQELVGFAHARSASDKDARYGRILRSARFKEAKPLAREQYDCFRQWYIPVVREMAVHPRCEGDPAWIAARIRPRISVAQVERSLETLLSVGLLERHGEKAYRQVSTLVRTPSEVESVAVAEYHRSVIGLAADSIDAVPSSERDIRSATLGVSLATAKLLKEKMESVWREVLEQAGREALPEIVLQFNTQLFPLARAEEEKLP